MEPNERHRLQHYYTRLDDDRLGDALAYGPDAYVSSQVWKIIAEEAARRGVSVPNQAQLEAHWAALQADHEASQPPPLPAGWAVYGLVSRLLIALVLFVSVDGLAALSDAENRQEGWVVDLSAYLVGIGLAVVAIWARHRQLAAVRERLRGPASSRDAA